MPVKQTIPYNYGIYSITFTCYNWLQLIDIVNGYDIVYRWFDLFWRKYECCFRPYSGASMSVALGTSTLRFNAILHTCANEVTLRQIKPHNAN